MYIYTAGGGAASTEVTTITLDTIVGDNAVEMMLLTCQGFEWQVCILVCV